MTEDRTMTIPVGETTPMDRQRLCAGTSKTGHLMGTACGKYHWQHIHLFDARMEKVRCFEYPKCSKTLTKIPATSTGKHHKKFGDYIVAWEGE